MESDQKSIKFDCEDIEQNVHAFLDGKLNEAQKILFQEHLDYCLPCDKKIEFEKKLKEIIKLKAVETSYPDKLKAELKKIISKKNL